MPVTQPVNPSTMEVAKGVRETVNQDGAVLLDIEQGLCFSLNPVGTRIWEMLKAGRSMNEIADKLAEEFALPRAQLLTDVSEFLRQLQDKKLVGEQSSVPEKHGIFSRFLGRRRSA
jgi:hypothetical protein